MLETFVPRGASPRLPPLFERPLFSPQANLAFDPAALLPGASPKSPGLKAAVSPFHSPPSTPSSPGVRPQAGEPEEVPISFDQPPEGSHLPCYNKVTPGWESAVCPHIPARGGHVWAKPKRPPIPARGP